ncbi:MAG: adenosylcobinamide-GDP ribazoletransferase [Terriglobia bacterium]|nr:MAG: adenosylcobinamide-GDP ribazoletransferase [Terriglobia bacterium]
MKSLLAAISFLTRFPAGRWVSVDAKEVARSAGWFPLVGLLVGAVCGLTAWLLRGHLPFAMVAIILVVLDAVLTGALHFDGLADAADGFGGGRDREDILRIMRDHAIGSYGGTALILLIAWKLIAYGAILQSEHWLAAIIITPALGRWSILLLTATLPYARPTASVVTHVGKSSLIWGTLIVGGALAAARLWRVWAACAFVVFVSAAFGIYCHRRIGGITGDTLGANLELCEGAALLAFLWGGNP